MLGLEQTQWELVEYYLRPIEPFLNKPGVTEICVNRFDQVVIKERGEFHQTGAEWDDEAGLVACIEQIAMALGQELHTDARPLLDARLPDGSRINAVLRPVAHTGANMTIRLFPKVRFTADDLLGLKMFDAEMLAFFDLAVRAKYNILIAGGTDSGKTTLLSAIANLGDFEERVIVIEDTAELKINKSQVIGLEAARRGAEAAPLSMADLLANTLRQNPDRVLVGEVRAPDAATALQQSLNTGHQGVISTLHANNAADALVRLTNLLASNGSGVPYEAIQSQVRSNFQLVIYCAHLRRGDKHLRRVMEIMETGKKGSRLLWKYAIREDHFVRHWAEDAPPELFSIAEDLGIAEEAQLLSL